LICFNQKLPNYWYNIFNVNTGAEIGDFVRKGLGPRETTSAGFIDQLFKKENDLMTLVRDIHNNRIFVWNISQSIEQGVSVYDSIVPHNSKSERSNEYYDYTFYRPDEEALFAYVQSKDLQRSFDPGKSESTTTPFYETRTLYTNELIEVLPLYTEEIAERKTQQHSSPHGFFTGWSAIKPDASKIVQAMEDIPQINIIDTQTGDVIGYRAKGGYGFSQFNKVYKKSRYYRVVQADDNFIYASYKGKNDMVNTIHIFDWHGRLLYELIADRRFSNISLCQVRNRLYTMCAETDEVYYIELNELNL
jgi:hypothetical protein